MDFSSDRWNEGAILLGHLQNVDDDSQSKSRDTKDISGAWGLRVRSPQNTTTGVGFFNSGRAIVPVSPAGSGK